MKKITAKEAVEKKDAVILDTRTPKEFALDHIPGAVNLPIFEDEERHMIGLIYKEDRHEAFRRGFEIYNSKLPNLTSEIEKIPKDKAVISYCWRGGMRSKTVAELIDRLGYDSYQVDGGYKQYRAYVRESLLNWRPKFRFIVLHGLAGCGKTEIIRKIEPSIDLEGFAQHRSSLFGSIGLVPNEQKRFDSLLWDRLRSLEGEKHVFIEGESHKVGKVFIPVAVFRAMKKGIAVRVNRPMDRRADQIVKDYFTHGEDEKIKEIILSLKQGLTRKVAEHLLSLIGRKEYLEVSRILLESYYDPKYEHHMEDIGIRFDYSIDNDDMDSCIRMLYEIKDSLETQNS